MNDILASSTSIADLLWAINSPELMVFSDIESRLGLLDTAAIDAEHLQNFVKPRLSHRVGDYFETLIEYYLRFHTGAHHLTRRLRITGDQKQTLGELDFLFQNENGQWEHWEVAVKFYLYSESAATSGSHWPGPNSRDCFEKKWRRLQQHQLPMGQRLKLPALQQRALIKGQLFSPWHNNSEQYEPVSLPLPTGVGNEIDFGIWMHQKDWMAATSNWQASRFVLAHKPFWLTPLRENHAILLWHQATNYIDEHFRTSTRPLLLFRMDKNKSQRLSKVFVVHDHWPGLE